ncbi:hypothetical protein [Streptomyces sp. NPDC056188]|uniref:hypothetical protein n=1 Tax=Streptomyces sp. NPDC056188 TaxID=3345740 RepID=UPI0035D6F922
MTSEVASADVARDDSAEENRPRGSMRHFWIFTGASAVSKLRGHGGGGGLASAG